MANDVHIRVSQLKKAFKTHYKYSLSEKEDISHFLLLFYAVECGLKTYYLETHQAISTIDFENLTGHKWGFQHNILEWIKATRLPNFGYTEHNEKRPINDMHERLRYGTFNASHSKEKEQIKFLKDLAKHLSDNL